MNTQNNNITNNNQCCVDYCKTEFNVSGKEIVNAYKCNQAPLTAADVWNIRRNKRATHESNLL
jgi:hypothetical protein